MDLVSLNRSIANLQARVKRIEDGLAQTQNVNVNALSSINLPRDGVDLSVNELPEGLITSSPLLGALYASEDKALTKFCIGTWPDETHSERSVAIHGGTRTIDGSPNEHTRMVLLPKLVNQGIAFSHVQADENQYPDITKVNNLVDKAASHIVIYTPGESNFKERILQAYLAGVGNKNIHLITHGESVLSGVHSQPIHNIIGPDASFSLRERSMEADNILNHFVTANRKTESATFDGDSGFINTVLVKDPDCLKTNHPDTVKNRRAVWKAFIENSELYPPKTDIGNMIAAAYIGGMVSPSFSSNYSAVQKESIEQAPEWLGRIKMYSAIAPNKLADNNVSPEENVTRRALEYFATLLHSKV